PGSERAAADTAPAATGSPAAETARTYQRSRGGIDPPMLEVRGTDLSATAPGSTPASARAAGDGERDEGGERDRDARQPSIPTNHRGRPPDQGGYRAASLLRSEDVDTLGMPLKGEVVSSIESIGPRNSSGALPGSGLLERPEAGEGPLGWGVSAAV